MDTWWWLALGAVIVLALVAALVDGRARLGPRRTAPPPPPGHGPLPGEIWWALVPYEDGPGSKDRPCLVLSVGRQSARVAKITSRQSDRRNPDVVPLPAGAVGDAQGRPSFLETDELREVPLQDFRKRAGEVATDLWDQVRHLAG